tara:strand:- start:1650 stop:2204 length:555 start_codon:yes stop_codon:yes gene_type:complete
MKITDLNLEGVKLIEPKVFPDNRGYFYESWNEKNVGLANFVQDNLAFNKNKNTVRGLHYQEKYFQAKLVSCVKGAIIDVVVDVRKDSETFGEWLSVLLSEDNNHQLWIPRGFAHGYRTLEDDTIVIYKADEYYDPDDYRGIMWNDPNLNIDWGFHDGDLYDKVIVSEQDKGWKTFKETLGDKNE